MASSFRARRIEDTQRVRQYFSGVWGALRWLPSQSSEAPLRLHVKRHGTSPPPALRLLRGPFSLAAIARAGATTILLANSCTCKNYSLGYLILACATLALAILTFSHQMSR